MRTAPSESRRVSLWVALAHAVVVTCATAHPATSASAPQDASIPRGRAERISRLRERNWEVQAVRIAAGEVTVDGEVEEPAWGLARPIADLYQGQRNEGMPASENTEIRILYDEHNLYIGFRCFDKHPELVRARGLFRDEWAGSDDLLLIMIDAYHSHRSAIQFVTNPNGLIQDALQTGETAATRNENFNAIWDARGRRTSTGFETEVRIPFKAMRFESAAREEEVVFGIGFKRNIRRKNEDSFWPFVPNDSSWYRPAELGHLRGLHDIEPGRTIELRPYALVGSRSDIAARTTNPRGTGGIDVKWGVTPGLTADFTVNTDFAQEEVDVQQINLTRFSLFFPEKRQFFLENAQMFQFGLPSEVDLVFTRRIGLTRAGVVVPIDGGARLTGREGRTNVGVMSMKTRDAVGQPGQYFSVVRLRQEVSTRSSIGALVTSVVGGGAFNSVVGADAHLLLHRVWSVEGFVAGQTESYRSSASGAAEAAFRYDADRLAIGYRFLDVGTTFNPGVGFVQRRDIVRQTGDVRFSPRFPDGVVRQAHFKAAIDYFEDQRGILQTRERAADISVDTERGDQPGVTLTDRFEFLEVPFAVNGSIIPPGAYRTRVAAARFKSYTGRHARLNASVESGGFWNGDRTNVSIQADHRVNKHLALSLTYQRNWVALPDNRFQTTLIASRILVPFKKNLGLQSLFQYNSDTKQVSTNVRLHWLPTLATDFYFVYTELDERPRSLSLLPRTRSLTVKLNHQFTR